jgi:hypothetical protein
LLPTAKPTPYRSERLSHACRYSVPSNVHVTLLSSSPLKSMRSSLVGRPLDAPHGAELVGELGQCEDSYRLCYVRGPEGIIVALAEQLS